MDPIGIVRVFYLCIKSSLLLKKMLLCQTAKFAVVRFVRSIVYDIICVYIHISLAEEKKRFRMFLNDSIPEVNDQLQRKNIL
jgi:hypothetical protein